MTTVRIERRYSETGTPRIETIMWGEAWGHVEGIALEGHAGLWLPMSVSWLASTNAKDPYGSELRPGVTLLDEEANEETYGEAVPPDDPVPINIVPETLPPAVYGDEDWLDPEVPRGVARAPEPRRGQIIEQAGPLGYDDRPGHENDWTTT